MINNIANTKNTTPKSAISFIPLKKSFTLSTSFHPYNIS